MTSTALGVTGSRLGASPAQLAIAALVISGLHRFCVQLERIDHGDCVGADAQIHEMARAAGLYVVGHPPRYSGSRAFCAFDVELPPAEFNDRNRSIVDATHRLLALPETVENQRLRSGTWSTVRYATKKRRPVLIVYRDGSEEYR